MEYFVTIVEHGSFRRAAEALHITQPALSRAIKKLEHEIGASLFRRTRTGVTTTPVGDSLTPRARSIIADFEALRWVARVRPQEVSGQVRVAVSQSPAIEPMTSIVAAVVQRHPALQVLGVGSHTVKEASDEVVSGSCEVAIFGGDHRPRLSGTNTELFYMEELAVAVPPGFVTRKTGAFSGADFNGLPFIASPTGTYMRKVLDEFREQYEIPIVAQVAHRGALLPMVQRGLGFAFVSRALARSADQAGVDIRGLDPPIEVPVWLVTRKDLSVAARAFVAVARDTVRDLGIRRSRET